MTLSQLDASPDMATITLSVVMPVYNEEECLPEVLREWRDLLGRMGIDYEFVAYDDESRDSTPRILDEFCRAEPDFQVRHQRNRGHGPTVLAGYREARGDWVLQIDSDGEIPASAFPAVWNRRGEGDFILGARQERKSPLSRRAVTRLASWTVGLLYGKPVQDANCPFRLMRRTALQEMVGRIPEDTFAPNVILSGLAARRGLLVSQPVPHIGRHSGTSMYTKLGVWKLALRAFRQTLREALHRRD